MCLQLNCIPCRLGASTGGGWQYCAGTGQFRRVDWLSQSDN